MFFWANCIDRLRALALVGVYAMYNNDINFGISFKPFKDIHWQFGFELVAPIQGVNLELIGTLIMQSVQKIITASAAAELD